jgi:hypothetical protein
VALLLTQETLLERLRHHLQKSSQVEPVYPPLASLSRLMVEHVHIEIFCDGSKAEIDIESAAVKCL